MPLLSKEYVTALEALEDQREWVVEHGGNLAGYVARYGSKEDPEHYGDGGEAIYEADKAALDRAQARVDKLVRITLNMTIKRMGVQ